MQTETQPADRTRAAALVMDVGVLLGKSGCNTMECVEALSCVLGDALAQTSERKFCSDALHVVTLFLTEAYTFGCTLPENEPTIQ
jgi:hypothetical protein